MDWLNYHHLLYFWVVAREGSITRACEQLKLAQPTISAQLQALERALGERLFERAGRGLALTETGRVVFTYADEIFKLGQEMVHAVQGETSDRPMRLVVGIADVLPKLIVYRLLQAVLHLERPVRIVCREGKTTRLLADLSAHNLDVVLSDTPTSPLIKVKAFNHLLGECGLSFFGTPALVERYGQDFPRSLEHAPFLIPTEDTSARRLLEHWLRSHKVVVDVRGEFEDSALIKSFGAAGEGLFVMPTVIEREVCKQYGVEVIGRAEELVMRFYAITPDRRIKHPAVHALTTSAKRELFS
ncbi:MAG: transcriptional activator NhaR [Gemmataceae bacterium]